MMRPLFAILLLALAQPAFATEIEWESTVESVKPAADAESHTFPFQFRNTGTEPIRVVAALPTCECTTTHFDPGPVPPGETGIITATLHFEYRVGLVEKGVTVYFDRNPKAAHELIIKAELPEYYTLEPAKLTWPIQGEQRVRLTFPEIDPGKVNLEELPPAYPIQARLQAVAEQPATYDIFIRPGAEAPLKLQTAITLQVQTETELPRLHTIPIAIEP